MKADGKFLLALFAEKNVLGHGSPLNTTSYNLPPRASNRFTLEAELALDTRGCNSAVRATGNSIEFFEPDSPRRAFGRRGGHPALYSPSGLFQDTSPFAVPTFSCTLC